MRLIQIQLCTGGHYTEVNSNEEVDGTAVFKGPFAGSAVHFFINLARWIDKHPFHQSILDGKILFIIERLLVNKR